MTNNIIKIVGLTGSLRRNSYNKAALRAAQMLLSENTILDNAISENAILENAILKNAVLDIVDLAGIPFFNEDDEERGLPTIVADFRAKLSEADAVLISTPEYNFSIPPVLKNALDWASRGDVLPLYGKPLAIMSASTGRLGGSRVQYHLRQVCVSLNLIALNKPEVFIAHANTKFDKDGNLIDENTKKSIMRLLKTLVENVENN
jgi:chromate reductase